MGAGKLKLEGDIEAMGAGCRDRMGGVLRRLRFVMGVAAGETFVGSVVAFWIGVGGVSIVAIGGFGEDWRSMIC